MTSRQTRVEVVEAFSKVGGPARRRGGHGYGDLAVVGRPLVHDASVLPAKVTARAHRVQVALHRGDGPLPAQLRHPH
eukprot:890501-Pyramimonas_sp.AAC.1